MDNDSLDPLAVARAYVLDAHPESAASALAGSVATGRGTPTSDLDIVIYYGDRQVSFAETTRSQGWLIEAFVYGPEGIDEWFSREITDRRPVALDMWATGIPLTGEAVATRLQSRARGIISAGPRPLDPKDRGDLRYALTSAVDDLEGSQAPAEEFAIAADVFRRAGELLLLERQRWIGTGKWLVRRLAQAADPRAQMLIDWAASPDRSRQDLTHIAIEILATTGGRLQEGHLRGTKPDVGNRQR